MRRVPLHFRVIAYHERQEDFAAVHLEEGEVITIPSVSRKRTGETGWRDEAHSKENGKDAP
eukprot:8132-Pelagococcus_subviridis.AAC.2